MSNPKYHMEILQKCRRHVNYKVMQRFPNQIRSKLSNRRPDVGGLFSMKDAKVKISRWHFDLNSEGYEDQP
jgi:hypothetical protein